MEKQVKILFAAQVPPPLHGAALLNSVVIEVAKTKYMVEVVPIKSSGSLKNLGVFRFQKVWISIKILVRIFFLKFTLKPDIFYFTPNVKGFAFARDFVVICISKPFFKRTILHLHGLGIRKKSKGRLFKLAYELMLSKTTIIHVSEKVLNEELEGLDLRLARPRYASNSIDCTQYRIADKNKFYPLNVVHMSNLRESKGILDVLEIAAIIKRTKLDVIFTVIGDFRDEELKKFCADFVDKNDLKDMVFFVGGKWSSEKIVELSKGDIFVYPTYDDAFGLVMLEAMASGMPVLTYDEGSTSEIISDGIDGKVFRKGQFKEISSAIISLYDDPQKLKSMSIAAQLKVNTRYNIDLYKSRILEILSECAAS